MKELYGIDLPVLVNGRYPFIVRVPGWVNFSMLRQWQPKLTVIKRGKR